MLSIRDYHTSVFNILKSKRCTTFISARMRDLFEKHLDRMHRENIPPERVAENLIECAIVMRDR